METAQEKGFGRGVVIGLIILVLILAGSTAYTVNYFCMTVYDQQEILNLQREQIILSKHVVSQGANKYDFVKSFKADYAGYIEVSLTSTTSNAYVIVEFKFQETIFSRQVTVGFSGKRIFCVLPSSVFIYVGNTNWYDSAIHAVTITYHY